MKYLCDESIGVAAGTIDEVSQGKMMGVTQHIFVGQKAGWHKLPEDGVGRCEGFTVGLEEKLARWKDRKEQS